MEAVVSTQSTGSGDAVQGCSKEIALKVAEYYAHLHSCFWNSKILAESEFTLISEHINKLEVCMQYWKVSGDKFKESIHDIGISPDILEAVDKFEPSKVIQKLRDSPWTIIHGDPHLNNMLFCSHEPILVDWQLVEKSKGARDIVSFLIYSLSTEVGPDAHQNFWDVLKHYHSSLILGGVTDYSWEDFQNDVIPCVLEVLVFANILKGTSNTQNEEQARLFELFSSIRKRLVFHLTHWSGPNILEFVNLHLSS
eukprot:TRINITY_DN1998_c0_g1_i5.p1 TRINITY_DN1998_c0_g1~~TRINITY_DN1998_c0_g1_i5.p1  ORF type:complete len:253 (+),score=55.66 TRINITY_DN1998_c0_g1_i5:21-779(+)